CTRRRETEWARRPRARFWKPRRSASAEHAERRHEGRYGGIGLAEPESGDGRCRARERRGLVEHGFASRSVELGEPVEELPEPGRDRIGRGASVLAEHP